MANNIAYAKQYINNQVEHLSMFERNLLCADLFKRPVEIKGNTISYDRMSFASYVMGDYNRATGLAQKDLIFERVDKILSQDRGDTLGLDLADKDEGQIAEGIEGIYNFYQVKVEVPTVDSYAFAQFRAVDSGANFKANGGASSANAYEKLLAGESVLLNKRIKLNECILYCSISFDGLLRQANLTRAFITVGSWNGSVETNIQQIDGMKLVKVPDATLGCDFIIAHPLSASVIDVLKGAEYKDNVPGKVMWAQIDVRDRFDAWVEPSGGDGILVAFNKPTKVVLPADFSFDSTSGTIEVSGIIPGAKVYYGTATGITTSSTELTKGDDGKFKLPSVSATTTYYVCQAIDGVLSEEHTVKATKN